MNSAPNEIYLAVFLLLLGALCLWLVWRSWRKGEVVVALGRGPWCQRFYFYQADHNPVFYIVTLVEFLAGLFFAGYGLLIAVLGRAEAMRLCAIVFGDCG